MCGRVDCTRHGRTPTGWAKYVRDHPERAAFYKSGGWAAARGQHLASHPTCAACGAEASIVDHRVPRAEGGPGLHPANLQSLCDRCHQAKTIEESHRGRTRAAERRRRKEG
jgi:5-methylcytosine-specific restriction endonuclease McrA